MSPSGGNDGSSSDDATRVACFVTGTLIATPKGEVMVEALQIGDPVSVLGGSTRMITWIGQRRIDCRRHAAPDLIRPIRIQAGAFGPDCPSRDLHLSPDHAVFAEDVLIPIKFLINGSTVAQTAPDAVHYFHVELARHSILLAAGLPVESYLNSGDRDLFDQDPALVTVLHPVFGQKHEEAALTVAALSCAPLRIAGREIDRLRQRLAHQSPSRAEDVASPPSPPAASPIPASGLHGSRDPLRLWPVRRSWR
jgi:hypothetical protein